LSATAGAQGPAISVVEKSMPPVLRVMKRNLFLLACFASACAGALSLTTALAAEFVTPILPTEGDEPGANSAPKAQSLQRLTAMVQTVTSTSDGGPGSLRQVIADAAPGDTITFSLTFPAVIQLTNRINIDRALVIAGPGPDKLTVMRSDAPGTPGYRIFRVNASGVTISGLTLRNGQPVRPPAPAGAGDNVGGAIYSLGSLMVSNCLITGNYAPTTVYSPTDQARGFGGGIFCAGPLNIYNSTICSNSATHGGGGIYDFFATGFLAEGCAVYQNEAGVPGSPPTAEAQGGGIACQGVPTGGAWLRNCTVSGNIAHGFGGGGGVLNLSVGSESSWLAVEACTIAFNFGLRVGGVASVSKTGGQPVTTYLKNTLVANNPDNNFEILVPATLVSVGHNLDSDGTSGFNNGVNGDLVGSAASPVEARLAPLLNNGGMAFTHAFLPHSPAVDAGDCTDLTGNPLLTDQRGVSRPQGPACDIGAFEDQAPSVLCPAPVELEFAPSNGPTVTLTAMVSDPDGDPLTVVWTVDGIAWKTNVTAGTHPPAPESVSFAAVFGVGTHEVTVWVSDGNREPAQCTTSVTVLGTLGLKQNVLNELTALLATATNKKDREELKDAIEELEDSLEPKLWIDQTHLNPKHGKEVFAQEKETVEELVEILKDKKSSLPKGAIRGFINRIGTGDRLLAVVAIAEAVAAHGKPKQIAEARQELGKGDREWAKGDYAEAIEHYQEAWEEAVKAMK
jgi:hypothetical protein